MTPQTLSLAAAGALGTGDVDVTRLDILSFGANYALGTSPALSTYGITFSAGSDLTTINLGTPAKNTFPVSRPWTGCLAPHALSDDGERVGGGKTRPLHSPRCAYTLTAPERSRHEKMHEKKSPEGIPPARRIGGVDLCSIDGVSVTAALTEQYTNFFLQ